jgi:hypothetical protein
MTYLTLNLMDLVVSLSILDHRQRDCKVPVATAESSEARHVGICQ